MPRLWIPLIVLVAALAGCAPAPQDDLASHLDAMVSVLESNRDKPVAAAEALEAYVATHKEELSQLRGALEAKRGSLSKDEQAELAADLLLALGPIMRRAEALMREKPALAESERIRQVLAGIER